MANFSTMGLDELERDIAAVAEMPDSVILEMLTAEAEIVAAAQAAEARSQLSGRYSTGKTASSVTYDKKLKKSGSGKAVFVYPKGTRSDRNRRSVGEVAFINEFGKKGQPARPFIQAANEKSAESAVEAAAQVYDKFLKSKNL